ncbi:MAG: SCO family protein [Anaerolineae bacterium]|nr:SCO family protein [Anaerolineae bacterium]
MKGYSRRWLIVAAGLAVMVLLVSGCRENVSLRGLVFDPPKQAPDFTLTDHTGRPFSLADQRGKVVLLYFGFASCPDVCPSTLTDLARMKRELGRDGNQVQVALITVDPNRDTPQVLADYVTVFDPSFIGLHGSEEQVQQLMKQYGVTAVRKDLPGSALGYTIDHTAFVHVIDQSGRWREQFPFGASAEDMAGDVRQLIRSGGRL